MFSQPHCRVELLGAFIRFTVSSPVCRYGDKIQLNLDNAGSHLLFIGSKQSVVVEVARPDNVLASVFRYESSVRSSVERSLTIQTDSKRVEKELDLHLKYDCQCNEATLPTTHNNTNANKANPNPPLTAEPFLRR